MTHLKNDIFRLKSRRFFLILMDKLIFKAYVYVCIKITLKIIIILIITTVSYKKSYCSLCKKINLCLNGTVCHIANLYLLHMNYASSISIFSSSRSFSLFISPFFFPFFLMRKILSYLTIFTRP